MAKKKDVISLTIARFWLDGWIYANLHSGTITDEDAKELDEAIKNLDSNNLYD